MEIPDPKYAVGQTVYLANIDWTTDVPSVVFPAPNKVVIEVITITKRIEKDGVTEAVRYMDEDGRSIPEYETFASYEEAFTASLEVAKSFNRKQVL